MRRWILALSCLLLPLFVVAVWVASSGQSRAQREQHINRTLAEIQRGNYFAWGQVWMWMDKMTPEEEHLLTTACANYCLSNSIIHVTGLVWPPEKSAPYESTWVTWLKEKFGFEDQALVYDVIDFPPLHDLHLSSLQDPFFHQTALAVGPVSVKQVKAVALGP